MPSSTWMTSRSTRSFEAACRGRRLRYALGGALLIAALPCPARAETPLELDWQAPAGCPQAGSVRARVRALLGDAAQEMARLHAAGRVERVERGYRLTLSVHEAGAARERVIESTSCSDLAGAAAVALGLWLRREPGSARDASAPSSGATSSSGATPTGSSSSGAATSSNGTTPTGAASAPTSSSGASASEKSARDATSSRERDQPPTAMPSESPASEPPAGPSSPRQWRAFVRAPLGALDLGRLPSASLGWGADLGIRSGDWRWGGGARIFKNQTLWSRQFPEIGAEVERFTAEVRACRRWLGARLELSPCVALAVDRSTISGVGPNVAARAERTTSFAFGAGGSAHLHATQWLALVGSATLSFESARPRLSIAGLDELRQLGPVVVGFTLASEWIF